MKVIDRVLSRPEFAAAPPVLIDVGASSGLNPVWREIAKHSVCIAFDPDSRGMGKTRRETSLYKRLHVYDRALTVDSGGGSELYLTKDAPCSSTLPPNREKLAAWEFAERFEVLQKIPIRTISMVEVLAERNLSYVDWFKTDSQGIDLRLFLGLGEEISRKVLVAEFEPGILDAYIGEDKLWQVMACMDERGFWMSDMILKGSNKVRKDLLTTFHHLERKYMLHLLKRSPGWAEVTYLNSLQAAEFNTRDHLLAWVCATVKRQHGFAFEVAVNARERFNDDIFAELERHSLAAIRKSYWNLPAYLPLVHRAFRRWKRLRFASRTA